MNVKEGECECMELIHLTEDSFQWQVLVYTVLRLQVP